MCLPFLNLLCGMMPFFVVGVLPTLEMQGKNLKFLLKYTHIHIRVYYHVFVTRHGVWIGKTSMSSLDVAW
jgi:hypothetical protein